MYMISAQVRGRAPPSPRPRPHTPAVGRAGPQHRQARTQAPWWWRRLGVPAHHPRSGITSVGLPLGLCVHHCTEAVMSCCSLSGIFRGQERNTPSSSLKWLTRWPTEAALLGWKIAATGSPVRGHGAAAFGWDGGLTEGPSGSLGAGTAGIGGVEAVRGGLVFSRGQFPKQSLHPALRYFREGPGAKLGPRPGESVTRWRQVKTREGRILRKCKDVCRRHVSRRRGLAFQSERLLHAPPWLATVGQTGCMTPVLQRREVWERQRDASQQQQRSMGEGRPREG